MKKIFEGEGVKLHYVESGNPDGKPVIIMHGWGCSSSTVESIARLLEPEMHVFNIDLPGHGDSSEPETVWGVEDFASLMRHFINVNNLDSPSLIGHSFGGRVSIILATQTPVNKVVLIDSAGIKPKRNFSYYYKVGTFKMMKKMLRLVYGKEKSEKKLNNIRNKRGSADYRNSSPMMRAIMSKCVNQDLKKYMPSIKAPTLLVWGENDTATPLSDARIMNRLIPDSGLVSFPGCGHYSFLDNPRGFSAVMKEFFKSELSR